MMPTPLQPDEDYEVYKEILKGSDNFAVYRRDILMAIEPFRGKLYKFKHLDDGSEHEAFIDANFILLKSWVCIDTVGVYSGKYRLALFILLHHLTRKIQNIGTDDHVVEYVDADVARHERIDQKLKEIDDYYLQVDQQERLERIYRKQSKIRTFNVYDLDLKSLEAKFKEILQDEIMCEESGVWAIHLIAEEQLPRKLMIPKLKAYFEENHVNDEEEYLATQPITFSLSLQDDFLEDAQKFADLLHRQVRSPLKGVCPEDSLIKNILISVDVEFKGGRHDHDRLYEAFRRYCTKPKSVI
ncbi:MAG: hypothetical protein IPM39_19440 [Chloroflexi bacterium]|nr:hypothetical protein [Chloroflexota bacterium]